MVYEKTTKYRMWAAIRLVIRLRHWSKKTKGDKYYDVRFISPISNEELAGRRSVAIFHIYISLDWVFLFLSIYIQKLQKNTS